MTILFIFLYILCHISFTLAKFWVYWPSSITWWYWRFDLKLHVNYEGFYVLYFYEWTDHYFSNYNSRLIWIDSEFKEPGYFEKISSFVPSYLRRNCDSDGIDVRQLHYYTSSEDIRRNYQILKSVGGTIYYDNHHIHTYVSFLYNVCNCLHGNSISYTCPDPCRKPDICMIEKNVIKGSCQKVHDKRIVPNLKDGDFKNIFGKLYQYRAVCSCKRGFIWNKKAQTCDLLRSGCDLKRIGDRVCQHGGKCVPVAPDERLYDFLVLQCLCTPPWTGYLCTEPVNPCLRSKRLCGSFICRRDATSISKGYYCACTKGFRRYSQSEPRCVNINECQDVPCQHGGKCMDLTPDPLNAESLLYNCTCIRDFTGQNCEIPPKRPQWSAWSPWSICSKSCGIGQISRQRLCSVSGRCSGLSSQSTACILLGLSCDFKADSEQEQTLKKEGIGWTPKDERTIDDAFHWNEQSYATNPVDTLHYLGALENGISILISLLLIPFAILCIFNMIMLRPRPWLIMTVKSHLIRQGWIRDGKVDREKKKRKKKRMKNRKIIRGTLDKLSQRKRMFQKKKVNSSTDDDDVHSAMSDSEQSNGSEMSDLSEFTDNSEVSEADDETEKDGKK